MSNEYFRFKRFKIYHDRCAMKVGTDGVLLGSWAPEGRRILDIGTGTGLIALMMAQRFPESQIDAIEIDADASLQAEDNVRSAGYEERIKIFHSSLQDYTSCFNDNSTPYDCIVSNPPFYTEDTSCPESRRDTARHTSTLSYGELMRCVSSIISKDGTFSLIIPYGAKDKVIFEACVSGMSLISECDIRTTPRKTAKRTMLTFSKARLNVTATEEHCLMNADGSRSEWYKNITSDFYL